MNIPTPLEAIIDTAAAGDTTLVAAVPGHRIAVTQFFVVATGAVAVRFKSGANNKTGAMALAANGGLAIPAGDYTAHLFSTNLGEALVLNLGAAVQVSGALSYKLL